MEGIGLYIRSVSAAGILCAVLTRLLPEKSSHSGILKTVCGIVMVFAVVAPVRDISLNDLTWGLDFGQVERTAYIRDGENFSRETAAAIIKARTEAYILDKAASWSDDLSVEVGLSEDALPVPVSVRISGNLSPYGKSALSAILSQELGIEKEQQIWISTS